MMARREKKPVHRVEMMLAAAKAATQTAAKNNQFWAN